MNFNVVDSALNRIHFVKCEQGEYACATGLVDTSQSQYFDRKQTRNLFQKCFYYTYVIYEVIKCFD